MKRNVFVTLVLLLSIVMGAQNKEVIRLNHIIKIFRKKQQHEKVCQKCIYVLKVDCLNGSTPFYSIFSISSLSGLALIADYDYILESGKVENCRLKNKNYANYFEVDGQILLIDDVNGYLENYIEFNKFESIDFLLQRINDDFLMGEVPVLIWLQSEQQEYSIFYECSSNVPSCYMPYKEKVDSRIWRIFDVDSIVESMELNLISDTIIKCGPPLGLSLTNNV